MMVSVEKDKKGSTWIVSHVRCGFHEQIWLTDEELAELYVQLTEML